MDLKEKATQHHVADVNFRFTHGYNTHIYSLYSKFSFFKS